MRAALAETTQRLGRALRQPGGASHRRRVSPEPARPRWNAKTAGNSRRPPGSIRPTASSTCSGGGRGTLTLCATSNSAWCWAAWEKIRVAAGTKGPRVFDWAALRIHHPYGQGLAALCAPAPLALRRAGDHRLVWSSARPTPPWRRWQKWRLSRWAFEESFAQSKSEVGLDQYEVRSWTGWHRHMTLVMTEQALLAITPRPALRQTGGEPSRVGRLQKKAAGCRWPPPPDPCQCGRSAPLLCGPALGNRASTHGPRAARVQLAAAPPGSGQVLPLQKHVTPLPIYHCNIRTCGVILRQPRQGRKNSAHGVSRGNPASLPPAPAGAQEKTRPVQDRPRAIS